MKYRRVLLKISGEALSDGTHGIDDTRLREFAEEIKVASKEKTQIGIVIGAGNFWRGRDAKVMERSVADSLGMLGTVMNSMALGEALEKIGVKTAVVCAFNIEGMVEKYSYNKVMEYFSEGKIVIFAGGTGHPYFTTDTGGALRAIQIHADALLCAKSVDGIYDSDPRKNINAKKYDKLSFQEVIDKDLKALDMTSIVMCKENNLPLICFDCKIKNSIARVISGEKIGTVVE